MTASERRSEIIRILVARRFETISHLAIEFSVTQRTIQSDIEALTAEYPIDTLRGRSGGVRLKSWYTPYSGLLSKKQQLVLLNLIPRADEYEKGILRQILAEYGTPEFSENARNEID